MSKTVEQIYVTNPTTVVADTDLYYLVQTPYTPGTDAAITGASLKAAFGSGGTINPGLINQIAYYAAAGSTLSGLTTLASGVLITSAGGAPSISTTLPAGLTIPGYAHSGANSDITSMTGLTGKLQAPTAIADSGSRNVVSFSYAGAAVNYLDISNANTGAEPNLSAQGTDPDIVMRIQSKGNKWLELISQTGTTPIKLWPNTSGLNLFKVGFDIPTLTASRTLTIPDADGTIALTSGLLTSPLTTKGDLWGWSTTNDRLPVGSTNGQVLQVLSSASLGLAYSTATYPTVATSAARILRADGTNWVQTTSTFADTYAASGFLYANGANNVAGLTTANNGVPVTSNTGVPSILAGPGTTGNMFISNAAAAPSFSAYTMPTTVGTSGSIHISNGTNIVSSTSLWPNTVGTAGKIVRSDGTTNAYSTSTFADTYSASTLLYSNGANTVTGLTTANNGLLVTSSAGVPSILAGPGTTGNFLQSNAAAAPSFSTSTITLGGNFTTSGAFTTTFTMTGNTNVTFPTSGTLATTASTSGRFIGIQVFTASGSNTYTPSAGVNNALVKLWAGGGGGGASSSATTSGGGGGAGSYAESYVAVSGAVTISIGAGGNGQAQSNGTAGTNGADTTYNTTTIVAKGGSFGSGGTVGAGGIAGTGTITMIGGKGNNATDISAVGGFVAGGGSSPGNIVMPSSTLITTAGVANSGQGGGAGNSTNNGGAGGSGYAIVYEYS